MGNADWLEVQKENVSLKWSTLVCNIAFQLDVSKPLHIVDLYFGMVEEWFLEYCYIRKKLYAWLINTICLTHKLLFMFFWYNLNFPGVFLKFMWKMQQLIIQLKPTSFNLISLYLEFHWTFPTILFLPSYDIWIMVSKYILMVIWKNIKSHWLKWENYWTKIWISNIT